MKKIILILTLILATVAMVFATIEVVNYFKEKNKIDNNTKIQEVDEQIKKTEEKITEKKQIEEKLREDNKEKVEELETWQKKVKEMEENL